MRVEDLNNYGKDIITIQNEIKIPIKKKLKIVNNIKSFIFDLIKEMKLTGFIRFIKVIKQEKQRALEMDWTDIKATGISEANLNSVITKEVVAKVMVDFIGYDKATEIRSRFSNKTSYLIMEQLFAPSQTFENCGDGDFLIGFKEYYKALANAMKDTALEISEVVEDSKDCFQLNVTYCVYNEVAKQLGSSKYCLYSTCYGDEVFFPKLCEGTGYKFSREGTLASGNRVCDMRFEKIKAKVSIQE